jgi:hypothetical protein
MMQWRKRTEAPSTSPMSRLVAWRRRANARMSGTLNVTLGKCVDWASPRKRATRPPMFEGLASLYAFAQRCATAASGVERNTETSLMEAGRI